MRVIFFWSNIRLILSQSRGVLEPKDFLRGLHPLGSPLRWLRAPPNSTGLACRSLRLLFPPILFTPGIMSKIEWQKYCFWNLEPFYLNSTYQGFTKNPHALPNHTSTKQTYLYMRIIKQETIFLKVVLK